MRTIRSLVIAESGPRAGRRACSRALTTVPLPRTFSIVLNRIWAPVIAVGLSALRGDDPQLAWIVPAMTTWLSWTIPLILLEWWFARRR
ncbi:hypothetical protein [Saccharopolyspora griseoalba]|uniref:Uncharacterized protein n=1 Tax=Saccharopolyspora griseoalba TaxID=1431848 RepID=A0ABW2LHF7_9PSEU